MEGLDVDLRIIINWIEENGVGVSGLDLSLIILFGSIVCGYFFDQLKSYLFNYLVSQ
jgi:hypothetical protein